jgi:5-methyltetrahydrofolate--homocysteine methyltransferase
MANMQPPRFSWEDVEPTPQTEPPLPVYDAARNHTPNTYINSGLTHPKIAAVRARGAAANALGFAAKIFGDGTLDFAQDPKLYPAGFPHFVRGRDSLREHITKHFSSKMAYYDGAMGTMIQKHNLEEEDFRSERFKDYDMLIKGNNDLLSMTKPDVIKEIYTQYLEKGSDMIGTNTFSGTTIAQLDYKMQDLVYEFNYVGARLARDACDKITAQDPTRPRFVAGAMAPQTGLLRFLQTWRIRRTAIATLTSLSKPITSKRSR